MEHKRELTSRKKSIDPEIKIEQKQLHTRFAILSNLSTSSQPPSAFTLNPQPSTASKPNRHFTRSKRGSMVCPKETGRFKQYLKSLLDKYKNIAKFHSKYKFDRIISDSGLMQFYKNQFYQRENRHPEASFRETHKQRMETRERLIKDGKYRTPSMLSPALEDDLLQESTFSNTQQIPPIRLRSMRGSNQSRFQDSESAYETMPQTESLSFAQNSFRVQTTRLNEKFIENNLFQSQPSPIVSEVANNFMNNKVQSAGKEQPAASNPLEIKPNK